MNYRYLATSPSLPPGATSPMMDYGQMTDWLNEMGAEGWEFVSYAQTRWRSPETVQEWWIFRREEKG